MTEVEGSRAFGGVIGRTVPESIPWWPRPNLPEAGSPDVVVVVLDDVGFSDLGCFGSDIETPHIDALAAAGLRFNSFHTTALCSPTRACLLTGRNHHSVGMGVVSNWDTGFPGYRGRVARSAGTLAEILRGAGYGTYAVGKWHLAPIEETTAAGPYDSWPLQRGFDRFYGFLDGATDHWAPDLVCDNHRVDPPSDAGYHLTEDLVDQAIDLIGNQVSVLPEKPYFLYLCFGTAHSPLHAPRPFIDKYRGRYDDGWDECRKRRLARQLELGVVAPSTELAPRNPGVRPWDDLDADERRWCARLQEVYAAMIDHTDTHFGRLMSFLGDIGRADNTLVVFLSDNGATLEGGAVGSSNYFRWVNGLPMGEVGELLAGLHEVGGPSTYPVYPMGWGQASNTPLKRYKQNTHSGGIRDPLIVSWPARLPERGAIRSQFHHAVDVLPTVLDLVGIEPPAEINGVAQSPIEGVSMRPAIEDGSSEPTKAVQYFEMLGNRAIWSGGWKAVTYHAPGSSFEDDRWELYRLDADFSECHDLAEQEPDRLGQLVERWWSEAGRYNVLPLDDRILERFLVPKPRPILDRTTFTYLPGARIPGEGAPNLIDVSYSLRAVVESAGDKADGVLICHGDRHSGYAFFLDQGHLVHDYNSAGTHYRVRSSAPVPDGPSVLSYRFRRTGRLQGVGTLLVDGDPVGEIEIPQTLGVHLNAVGVRVGSSGPSPVSPLYDGRFSFTGHLRHVVIEVGDDREVLGPHDILD